jgi:N-acetyl-anhydromuramyl-L-alanine amidase AmpD
MSITMPPVQQTPTPNYTAVNIHHDLIILHMMEGGLLGSAAWLCNPAVKASAHLCMRKDGKFFIQLVPLQYKAWAQCAYNSNGVSIETEGHTADGMTEETMRGLALATAWLCRAYGIPPTWAKGGQGRGVCTHHDLGIEGGGHVDLCGVGDATWEKLLGYIKEAYDAFGDGPLPDFALHGAPGPHAATLPPAVPQEPGHGGAARCEPVDKLGGHPTSSGYPAHSVMDLQWKLNRAGASVEVDGKFGDETREALEAFQKSHGCKWVDGMVGPESWAALDKVVK